MSSLHFQRLNQTITAIIKRYPGPGGAIAILHEGKVLTQKTWGYASLEQRIPFTASSLFRMCSITKQFTCGVMLDRYLDPEILAPFVKAYLPQLPTPHPTIHQLAHNQSGLRDYWATSMLHGAKIEGYFSNGDACRMMADTHSLHFTAGTSYSYVNQNFRLLSNAMEDESGLPFSRLLQQHIFNPVGMDTAFLAAETSAMPDGSTGYEGTTTTGYRPAINHIHWTGDAGLGASLNDMIAWEHFIDATYDDPHSLYRRLSTPVTFHDGTPASYGFGLQHYNIDGHAITAHGGALRGWRSHRLHCADQRLSIIVMFNHMSPAQQAANDLFRAFINHHTAPTSTPFHPPMPPDTSGLEGVWLDADTGLSARIKKHGTSLQLHYLMVPETLSITNTNEATSTDKSVRLSLTEKGIEMHRLTENRYSLLLPHSQKLTPDLSSVAGRYRCSDLHLSELEITYHDGLLYGGFSGLLGEGRMERLNEIGEDLWTFPCPRALDHTAPGDWTLHIEREAGHICCIHVGCWLARNLSYKRISNPF